MKPPPPPAKDGGTRVQPSACMTCATAACLDEARTCAASASCARALECADACDGDASTDCVRACEPSDPQSPFLAFARCFVDHALSACPSCGTVPAAYTNPLLTEKCGMTVPDDWAGSTPACRACLGTKCCDEAQTCKKGSECDTLRSCVDLCSGGFPCVSNCENAHPQVLLPYFGLTACGEVRCETECKFPTNPCKQCAVKECPNEYVNYYGNALGVFHSRCVTQCTVLQCIDDCNNTYGGAGEWRVKLSLCLNKRCSDTCIF